MYMTIFSYIFLSISSVLYGLSTIIKHKKWLLATQIVSGAMYVLSLYFLSAMVALIVAVFDIFRLVIFYIIELKNGNNKSKLIAGLFLFIVCIICSIFSWNGWYSILPITGSFLILISLTISNFLIMKIATLISSIFSTIYLALNGSYIASIIESSAIIFSIIGVIWAIIISIKNFKKTKNLN